MFFKSILPKIGIILIYSLVIESGLEAGFPSLTEEIVCKMQVLCCIIAT